MADTLDRLEQHIEKKDFFFTGISYPFDDVCFAGSSIADLNSLAFGRGLMYCEGDGELGDIGGGALSLILRLGTLTDEVDCNPPGER